MKKAIKLVLLYFVYQIAAIFLAMAGYYGWYYLEFKSLAVSGGIPLELSLVANLVAIFAMGWQLIVNKDVIIDKKSLNPGKIKTVINYIILGVTAFFWMNYLSDIANLPNWFENIFADMKDSILGIVSMCLVAPIFEELLFRGAIEGELLSKWKNPFYAILLSSFLFGIVHGNPAQLFFAICFGMVLGTVYYKTKSLTACIILHCLNNIISTILMSYFPDTDKISNLFSGNSFLTISIISFILFILILKSFLTDKCKSDTNIQTA